MTRQERIINDCNSALKDIQGLLDRFHADDSLTAQEKTILQIALTEEMTKHFIKRNQLLQED